jgi:hypothetical protein
MVYLYGLKAGKARQLRATFDSGAQLRAYVAWATLATDESGHKKFEQGSSLAGFQGWEESGDPLTDEPADKVDHNPSPSML